MANKKLKVEVELETAKAKRQAKELEQTATTPGGASGTSGGKLSTALDKAARSAEKSASSFDKLDGTAGRLTKGFAGIAVGMAASYAANYATGGTKTALDYGGSAVTGAVGGAMMAGLPGAIVGGLAGVLKTYMEKDAERSAMSKDFETGEAVYAATRRDSLMFDSLSSTKKGTDISANLAKAKEMIDNYGESAAKFVEEIRKELKKHDPDKEKIEKLKRNLDYSRQQISKYEGLTKSLESMNDRQKDPRTSTAALESLGKVGGDFVGSLAPGHSASPSAAKAAPTGGSFSFGFAVGTTPSVTRDFSAAAEGLADPVMKAANDRIERIDADQLQVLKDIKEALQSRQNGGSEWL